MNIFSIIPTIALLINGFVAIYIFAQKRKNRINRAYIYYSINLSFWIFCEIILRQDIPSDYIPLIFKLASIAWLSIGFWFLNFTYEFIDRRKDWIFYFLLALTVSAVALSILTDLVFDGYNNYYWGPDEDIGPMFIPLVMLVITFPGSFSLYLIYKKAADSNNELLKKSAPLIITGSLVSLIIALISNVLLPYVLHQRTSFQIAESISVIQSIFIFVAVYKYRLFGLGIEDLSYNIFSSMSDGIIITDSARKILHMNKSAEKVFDTQLSKVRYKEISSLINGLEFLNDNITEERELLFNDQIKHIALTKNHIYQSEVYIGCMLLVQDITERRITEKKLIESEATFSTLFESAPDALIVVDDEGIINQINEQVEKLFGYSRDELIGNTINVLIPPKYHEVHTQHIKNYQQQRRKREMGANLELFGLKKDKNEFPVDVMVSPITIFNKNYTLTTIRDITERKLSEKQLLESEKRFRTIFELLPHGIVKTDVEGTIVVANAAFAGMHGFNVEEIVGTKIWELQAKEDDVDYMKLFIEKAIKGKVNPQTEFVKRRTKDNNIIDVQVDWSYNKDEDGNINRFIAIVTDITERKKIENDIRKKRLLLSQAEQLAHLGSWEWDIAKDQLYWSDELYRIFGVDKNTFTPTYEKFINMLHPDGKEEVLQNVQNSIKTARPFFHFEKIVRPNGEIRILSTRGIIQTNSKNEVIGMYGSCLDVTEFKKIEADLLKSQKQLRALSASLQSTREEERTRIAREIHDELGQVLTAINMDIGLLIDDLENNVKLPKEVLLNNLKPIEKLIEKLIKSVQDISTELRPDVLDHLGLIPALEWHLKEFERRFKIDTKLEKLIDDLEIDNDKKVGIFRVFQEALTNVARHSKATEVNVILEENDNKFSMKIIDNGIGINEESIDDVASIGIIGMKERVSLLSGSISITENSNGGTLVEVLVPIN
ncbi:MAG: PAS domain S-box protein [Melioribacteraceae bacterium]|nr:PAS domain S-box protein [Melioribacteraceae bacterium]